MQNVDVYFLKSNSDNMTLGELITMILLTDF